MVGDTTIAARISRTRPYIIVPHCPNLFDRRLQFSRRFIRLHFFLHLRHAVHLSPPVCTVRVELAGTGERRPTLAYYQTLAVRGTSNLYIYIREPARSTK